MGRWCCEVNFSYDSYTHEKVDKGSQEGVCKAQGMLIAYQVLSLRNQLKFPLAPCAPTIREGWALMQREHWAGADFHRDPPSPFTSYTLATGLVETAAE